MKKLIVIFALVSGTFAQADQQNPKLNEWHQGKINGRSESCAIALVAEYFKTRPEFKVNYINAAYLQGGSSALASILATDGAHYSLPFYVTAVFTVSHEVYRASGTVTANYVTRSDELTGRPHYRCSVAFELTTSSDEINEEEQTVKFVELYDHSIRLTTTNSTTNLFKPFHIRQAHAYDVDKWESMQKQIWPEFDN